MGSSPSQGKPLGQGNAQLWWGTELCVELRPGPAVGGSWQMPGEDLGVKRGWLGAWTLFWAH